MLHFCKTTYNSLYYLESFHFVKFTESIGLPAIYSFENLDRQSSGKNSKCHVENIVSSSEPASVNQTLDCRSIK